MPRKPTRDGTAGKSPGGEEGVMGNLPATRPSRMSRRARAGDEESTPEPRIARVSGNRAERAASGRPRAGGDQAATAKPRAVRSGSPGKPRAVRAGSPELREPARKAVAARESATADAVEPKPQSGTELVTTVVRAAGELAQIGLTVGGQVLKRALPRRH